MLDKSNSVLRKNIDYYPESDFEIDPFGAFFEHEFIAILPFVPDNVIDEAYNSID